MIRDPGPLQNLGYGVTSRDVPVNEGEVEGTAPNSGYINSALNGHPVMRFFATTASTVVATVVASKLTKSGGIKLGKFLQKQADDGSQVATRIVKSVGQIRRELDELQGVSRAGPDPYSKIVQEMDGKYTTGYDGIKSERFGFQYLTNEERRLAGQGIIGEPPAVWGYKQELQVRLIRAGRRMPYELPAMYGVQKAITEPLFGERQEGERKVKWYNPFDVVADFTKQSVVNAATFILPFEFAGAGVSKARSSLHTLRYSMNDMASLTPRQAKAANMFVDVSEVLSEVGHDFATLTNKFLKKTAQASGGFAAAAEAYKQETGTGFVQTLKSLSHGVRKAEENAVRKNMAREQVKKVKFSTLFKGFDDPTAGPLDPKSYSSIFDLIPTFSGLQAATQAGYKEFKFLGKAYDAMQGSLAYNKVIASMRTSGIQSPEDLLNQGIQRIQSQHSSRLSSLAAGIRVLGGGGPGSSTFRQGDFYQGQQTDAFKDLLEQQIISRGVASKDAKQFVDYLKINPPRSNMHSTNIITIGKTKIYEDGADAADISDDFFAKVLKRYRGVKGGKSFEEALGGASALRESVEQARDIFATREFQKGLNFKISKDWNKFYRSDLTTIGSGVLKPKKSSYQDFVGPLTPAKQEFLQRKTAQTLGIPLAKKDGDLFSTPEIMTELRKRGFDPYKFTDLRAFLIKNRQMTSGIFGGGFNLFGMQAMTIDEARQSGRFSFMDEQQQKIINDIAGRMAINDPVSKAIGFTRLDGVYKTKGGQVLDFTSVKSTFSNVANFFASEFKIPILGFNPADLFGYRSFSEMAKRSPVQYVSSRSVQPFLKEASEENRADFYLWYKTKGSKGKVLQFRRNELSDEVYSTTLNGTYRALPTNSTDLLTRHARHASGMEGETVNEVRNQSGSRFLDRILGAGGQRPNRAVRFKRMMSIDSEQPNSLFGLANRFANRSKDLDNPSVMGKLIAGEEVSYSVRGVKKNIRLDINNLKVVDDAGNVIDDFSEADILRASNSLRESSFQYGLPKKVMEVLEEKNKQLFTYGGRKVSDLNSAKEATTFAEEILAGQHAVRQRLRGQGIDTRFLSTSASRIRSLLKDGNLTSISQMSERSPTITTRLDELKNEIFRYISQVNAIQSSSDDVFIQMQQAIDDLVKTGQISKSQRTEAQAAGLATIFNISAFKTFNHSVSNLENAKTAAKEMLTKVQASRETKSFLDPFTEGTLAEVSSGGIRKKFSPLLSPLKKKFGTGGFSPDDLSIDPLGTGQGVTLVPTFGTVFGRDPFGAVKSAIGIGTYKNPDTFSTGSIPMSQGVERLNRYFGTLGAQLDVSDFGGPLDLFARGMVGKRVLPLYAAGTTALTVDRTLGGMINEKDERGERVYSPLVLGQVAKGVVELQSLSAGITPGGMSYQEKKEQLVEGEVPIRQGRFWPLGNTPFKGGKIMYYRPSWYRKLQGGAMFTSDTYGSPMEKFLFYNDISPLRPFDPYRFEKEHYYDRPYPVTGEYFSGPFGPLVPFANMTVGKILKPQKRMHEAEVAAGLSNYAPAGEFGAYDTSGYTGVGGPPTGQFGGYGGGSGYGSQISASNARMASMAGATNTAAMATRNSIAQANSEYIQLSYGAPKVSGVMPPRIVASGQPLAPSNLTVQGSELGYRMQEMAGIYGFGFASAREFLGYGQGDFEPQRSVLQSASKAYGTTRAFWDLNLGGLGDVPLPSREAIGNIEFSEIVRRFIPKERTNVDYINPIRNTMGIQYPFLPGSEYFTDFTRGDPFTKVQEGELRLPGVAYERFNKLYSDETGRYGAVNQLDILGDVAPYSKQFKALNRQIDKMNLTAEERLKVQEIRGQVEDTTRRYEFSDYKYKDSSAEEMNQHPLRFAAGRMGEYIAHSDNFVMSKIFGKRTAVEDWERRNVYGATFPEWQRPFESYIEPMLNKATQENPITAAATLGFVGGMFGRTPRAKLFGTALGVLGGAGASLYGEGYEFATGERFIPIERKKEMALEEYADVLNYVKNTRLANQAKEMGDNRAAMQFKMAAKRTMYGADIYGSDVETLSLAIPKRKREHFQAMINAPESERGRILSTAGRLERRIYEAAWGMEVEKRPDLEDYFTRHELPDASWEGWHPNTNIDSIKIKMGQSMGIEMSQMGYYPQQIREANLLNPSYPEFGMRNDRQDVASRLRSLMSNMGLSGSVNQSLNPFGSDNLSISAGVR